MTEYTQEEAVFRMNEMGKAGRPFLFIIDYKRERIYVESPEEIAPSELLYDLNGFTNTNHECNLRDSSHLISGEPVEWQPSYVSFEEYAHSFETVSRHIHAGNSYLVNLTCATPVYTNLSLKDIFYHSKAMYKLWMPGSFRGILARDIRADAGWSHLFVSHERYDRRYAARCPETYPR